MARGLAGALALASALVPGGGGAAADYANPILFADYSDPDVIRVGRDFYLVASSFHFSPGLPVLKSRDLVHWTIAGHVLPRLPFADAYDMVPPFTLTDAVSKPVGAGLRYARGVWAPAIRFHAGRYYVYWPTPDEGAYMATATRPEGPWSAPVRVLAGPGYEDPCPFWDDDGTAWLIHGKVGAGPLILHRMSADGTRVLDEGRTIVDDPKDLPVLEGPKLLKRNGYYYIWAPFGGVETGAQVVLRARTIAGPYERRVVLAPGTTAVQGPHQGGYVETPSGQGWFVHFNSTGAFGRIAYLEPVHWQDDWPLVGDPIPGRPGTGQPVAQHVVPDVPPAPASIATSDDFAGARLGMQWEWNHNPDDRMWSLAERPGWLRLHATPAQALVTAHNTLTQILWGPSSRITARFDLARMADGQRAGLAMFQARPVWIGSVRAGGVTRVTLSIAGEERSGPIVAGNDLRLRVTVGADQQAAFAYSIDRGRSFVAFGAPQPLHFAWWKGARPALFSYSTAPTPAGAVDIDWVRVERPVR
ncbi:glycoside hydrolase family 43 protein [Sphingomonas nostoxanthinifaciens]|uniref:glycoside hydrolase family 43 protein n=1 Tax=Sphingomonas nostoxanthinifaciens TaxID=2872652 RepID=UPI001CC202A3|nr:glycoside hydrolase 43 family protein [Sphingomonas nostoxanthinifaciens]UAK26102.1 glycoside hydrolase 43 family protein [Sphingomonas nostoxanthinifaciens]